MKGAQGFAAGVIASATTIALAAAVADATAAPGFDLSRHAVTPSAIVSGGPGKDGIPALNAPEFLGAEAADRKLAATDRVVGVFAGGVAKAYPIAVLNWHEIVNDTVGETDVAITFCPLTDSAVVFERGSGDSTTFGVSGLLYQSNLLMYDRATDSLWSQLRGDAVAGSRTGERLRVVPAALTTWGDWHARHPDTQVLSERTGHAREYDRTPYPGYDGTSILMFPIQHRDPRFEPKQRVIGVRAGGRTKAYALSDLQDAELPLLDTVGDVAIRIDETRGRIGVRSNGSATGLAAYWFAWAAFHPDTELWSPAGETARATERPVEHARVSAVTAEWQQLNGMFLGMGEGGADPGAENSVLVLTGRVTNVSEEPIDHVVLKFELLDTNGATLYFEEGYNHLAEDLLDGPRTRGTGTPIEPGRSDAFRMLFFGEELPSFESHRVSVTTVR